MLGWAVGEGLVSDDLTYFLLYEGCTFFVGLGMGLAARKIFWG